MRICPLYGSEAIVYKIENRFMGRFMLRFSFIKFKTILSLEIFINLMFELLFVVFFLLVISIFAYNFLFAGLSAT